MSKPVLNQEVMINTLLSSKEYMGKIVEICPVTFLCTVKVKKSKDPVSGVMFKPEKPTEVVSQMFQICYPMEG